MTDGTTPAEVLLDERQARMNKVMAEAVREALLQHKRAGNPVAVWRDGKVVWIPAEEIPVDDDMPSRKGVVPGQRLENIARGPDPTRSQE